VIREECAVKEDVTKIEKHMLRRFGHEERMDKRTLTKEIKIFIRRILVVMLKGKTKANVS
jgi:hypothetical protein